MTNCTCAHLGTLGIHDPTNPACPKFSGADLRLNGDAPDWMSGEDEPSVHVQVVEIDGQPPVEPIGWTTTESGQHIPDPSPTAQEPTVTPDEVKFKPHAFTNIGDPRGFCTVCRHGINHPVHQHVANSTSGPDIPALQSWRVERDLPTGDQRDQFPAMAEVLNTQIAMPSLIVNVDLGDFISTHGETEAFRLLGLVKDLLQ